MRYNHTEQSKNSPDATTTTTTSTTTTTNQKRRPPRNRFPKGMDPPETYVRRKFHPKVQFHWSLAGLGKTALGRPPPRRRRSNRDDGNISNTTLSQEGTNNDYEDDESPEHRAMQLQELKILNWSPHLKMRKGHKNSLQEHYLRMDNPVFLYDVSQPFDTSNTTRWNQFRLDLSQFLALDQPLRPIPTKHSGHSSTINICDDKYRELRAELVQMGTSASRWIATYLLPLPDVTASSPEHFKQLLETWACDPCETRGGGGPSPQRL